MNDTRVYKAQSNNDYEDLINMLYDYVYELHDIDDFVKPRTRNSLKNEYLCDNNTEFYLVSVDDIPVGFAVLGFNDNCHPSADIYINEFYIMPEYRNKGFGRELFDYIISIYRKSSYKPFRVCLYILKKNILAQRFWEHVLLNTYKDVSSNFFNVNPHPEHLLWYMYEYVYEHKS